MPKYVVLNICHMLKYNTKPGPSPPPPPTLLCHFSVPPSPVIEPVLATPKEELVNHEIKQISCIIP